MGNGMKLDSETMLADFLARLKNKTAEQLLIEIEKAREDSKDSWMIDEEQAEGE